MSAIWGWYANALLILHPPVPMLRCFDTPFEPSAGLRTGGLLPLRYALRYGLSPTQGYSGCAAAQDAEAAAQGAQLCFDTGFVLPYALRSFDKLRTTLRRAQGGAQDARRGAEAQ